MNSVPITICVRVGSACDLGHKKDLKITRGPGLPTTENHMLLTSLIFTARHGCIAQTMPSQDVCLSICHTPVLSLNRYTYPQSFSPSGGPTILVFSHQMEWQYSAGNPPNGGIECKGV